MKIFVPQRISILSACLVFFLGVLGASNAHAGHRATEAVAKLLGQYKGEWQLFAWTEAGTVPKVSWTDAVSTGPITEEKDRAYTEVASLMTFPDGTTRSSSFKEGFLLNADGSLGNRFYEIQGKLITFTLLAEDVWVYHTTPDQTELWILGFDPKTVVSSSHVAVETTLTNGKTETDYITRLTTVQWQTSDGTIRSAQFESLKGQHTRIH